MLIPLVSLLFLGLLPIGEPAESVYRTYPLSGLLPRYDGENMPGHMVPHLRFTNPQAFGGEEDEMALESIGSRPDGGIILDWITEVLREEFEYEGRGISIQNDNTLVVYAPEEVQAKVGQFLEGIAEALTRVSQFQIDLVQLPSGGDLGLSDAMVVDGKAAERLLLDAEKYQQYRKSFPVRVQSGRTAVINQTRSIPLILGYEAEVASNSAIANPVHQVAETGTRMYLRAVPRPGGHYLALFLKDTVPEGAVRTRSIPLTSLITVQTSIQDVVTASIFQSLKARCRSLALNTFLPQGKALLLPSESRVGMNPNKQIWVIRCLDSGLSFSSGGAMAENAVFQLINWEMFNPPHFRFGGHLMAGPDGGDDFLRAELRTPDAEAIQELVPFTLDLNQDIPPWFFSVASPAQLSQSSAQVEMLSGKKLASPDVLPLRISLLRGKGGDLTTEGTWSLPVMIGTESAATLGIEDQELFDYEVQIAQGASTPEPKTRSTFEGLVFWVRATRGPQGSFVLDLRARADLNRGQGKEVELKVANFSRLDQVQRDSLYVDERIVLGRDGKGPMDAFLGSSPAGSATEPLFLRVEIVK